MAKNREFNILYIIISLFVALGLFLGSYNLYQKYLVEQPLVKKISNIEEVKSVAINKKDKTYFIEVSLNQVKNIQKTYNNIDAAVREIIKKDNYEIKVKDHRNPQLEQLFQELQPSIYQGLAQMQYQWLDYHIIERSQEEGISANLFVDEKRLYIQLEKGKSYLYCIIDYEGGEEQKTGRGGVI